MSTMKDVIMILTLESEPELVAAVDAWPQRADAAGGGDRG